MGWLLWSADWDQCELRLTACLSEDARMLRVYREGGDLHVVTAAKFSGMTLKEMSALKDEDHDRYDDIRYRGKAGTICCIAGSLALVLPVRPPPTTLGSSYTPPRNSM